MNRFIDINPERCIGCGTCQSACADAHRMQGLQDTPRLALVKTGGISAALSGHQCEGAPCAEVCPVNAIEHDGDRIHVKEQECIGCRLCAIACPFGAIHPDGAQHQPPVDRFGLLPFALTVGIQQHLNVKISVTHMPHDLKWEGHSVQVGHSLSHAIRESRNGHAYIS